MQQLTPTYRVSGITLCALPWLHKQVIIAAVDPASDYYMVRPTTAEAQEYLEMKNRRQR